MSRKTIALIALAVVLIGLAMWVHVGRNKGEWHPEGLAGSEIAAFKPGLGCDLRLLDHLRRLAGSEPGDWKQLPPAGQTLYATLYAEEVQRTLGWAQFAASAIPDLGTPTLEESASAYEELGLADAARDVRALAGQFAHDQAAFKAWNEAARETRRDPPDIRPLQRLASLADRNLRSAQQARLDFLRQHADELGIH